MAKSPQRDPWNELADLQAALQRAPLARGYALRGEERYFRQRGVALLKAKAEELGYEVCLHDVEKEGEKSDFHLAHLIDDLSGGGLFAAQRLVVVRNPGELLKKVERKDSPLTRAALAFVQSGADAGTLVVSDTSLRADHVLVKALVAAGGSAPGFRRLYDTPPPWNPDPTQTELARWTARRAGELGLRLDAAQVVYVCAATGNDLAALDDQLETLRASGGRDLRQVVSWTAGGTPWSVADEILDGALARALSGIEGLFHGGFQEKSGKRLLDPSALAIMIVSSLQRGACALLAELDGRRSPQAPRPSGRQAKALQARAARRPAADWRGLFEDSAALEGAVKGGGGLDASDFARLALRWSLAGPPRTAQSPRTARVGARS